MKVLILTAKNLKTDFSGKLRWKFINELERSQILGVTLTVKKYDSIFVLAQNVVVNGHSLGYIFDSTVSIDKNLINKGENDIVIEYIVNPIIPIAETYDITLTINYDEKLQNSENNANKTIDENENLKKEQELKETLDKVSKNAFNIGFLVMIISIVIFLILYLLKK